MVSDFSKGRQIRNFSLSNLVLKNIFVSYVSYMFQSRQHANCLGSSIKCVCKIVRKTNISNPLTRTRRCAYQRVRSVSFSENFAYVLNG